MSLPSIEADYCTGCNRCVEVCEHGCLALVWDFATLVRPADCNGEGRCMEACPEHLIQMS